MSLPANLNDLLRVATPEERQEIDALITEGLPWVPQQGPQLEAYLSEADILLYGGAAGGGKSDLLLGLAITAHQRSIIFRREGVQLKALYDRTRDLTGQVDTHNKVARFQGRQLDFGHCQYLGDERSYQGQPHDLIGFDEGAHFLESQVRFLLGWLRSAKPGQRCRVVITSNPPTEHDGAEAEWIIRWFAPWLDPAHPNPAKPGELRWYAVVDGEDIERPDGSPFMHDGREIRPFSRTFIKSLVGDNAYLVATDYERTLQALPEPLRSQMLHGDFLAAKGDNPWQIIPTAWVDAAMARWTPRMPKGEMHSMGVDVARGGKDQTVISRRHGDWYDEVKTYPGTSTPDSFAVAGLVATLRHDAVPVHVDSIGVGSAVYDTLASNGTQAIPVNVAEGTKERDKSGLLTFKNKRALLWWKFREALDPGNGRAIELPPDARLKAELTSARWKLQNNTITVESKDEVRARLGRSTDLADAVLLAFCDTPRADIAQMVKLPSAHYSHIGGGWMSA